MKYMILFLVVIQAVILMYDQVYATEGDPAYLITPYDSNDSTIWNFIVDPTGWTGTGLLTIFAGLIGLVGAIGIGVYMYTKSDTVLFFGVIYFLFFHYLSPILSSGVTTCCSVGDCGKSGICPVFPID